MSPKLFMMMAAAVLLLVHTVVGQTPSIKTAGGSIEFNVPADGAFAFKTGVRAAPVILSDLVDEISSTRSHLVALEATAASLGGTLNSTASALRASIGDLGSARAAAVDPVISALRSEMESIRSNANATNRAVAVTRAQVASMSMTHWTALRTVSTGDTGLCGGSETWLALLSFGLAPGVNYTVALTSTANASRTLTFASAATVDFDRPHELRYAWTALGDAWIREHGRLDNVSVALRGGGGTVVPYTGPTGNNLATIFNASGAGADRTATITVPISQFKYAESTSHIVGTRQMATRSRPRPDSGVLLATVEITPLHSLSRLIITATVTATEVGSRANHWMSTIAVGSAQVSMRVYCSGIEEAYTNIAHALQTMYITCVVRNGASAVGSPIMAGVPLTVNLRAGLDDAAGICVQCMRTGYAHGGGVLTTTLMVQEQGPTTAFNCENFPSGGIATQAQHLWVQGQERGNSNANIDCNFHHMSHSAANNVAPSYNSGHLLHTLRITPTDANSMLVIETSGQGVSLCNAGDTQMTICVYSSATRSAVVCSTDEVDIEHCSAYQQLSTQLTQRAIRAGTTDEITFTMRIGASRGTFQYGSQVNGARNNPNPIFGGRALHSTFSIREVKPYVATTSMFRTSSTPPIVPFSGTYAANAQRFGGFNSYQRKGGTIPWGRTRPRISWGSSLASIAHAASTSSATLELKCQGWMVESRNTADHTTVCIFANNDLLSCGVEEDTYGQQMLHGCHAKLYWRPGNTNSVTFSCRGGANGGSADYNGHNGNFLANTLWTQMTVNEIGTAGSQ